MADGTYKMPLSVRYVRTIIPFGEELCAPAGRAAEEVNSKAAQKFRVVCGGFCAKREKMSAGYYVMDLFVLK